MVENIKVGFFDSGVGGRTIHDAFHALCPEVETVYLADSANCPYGNKPREEIIRLSENCVKKLLRQGAKVIVVACNTATAAAIDYLRERYPTVPFVGLEPAVKPAALKSKSGIVAVLATEGTFNGRLYRETKARFAKDVTVLTAVADEFVALVEKYGPEVPDGIDEIDRAVAAKLKPLLDAGADRIVLGCTHFPHLRPAMERYAAGRAKIIDSTGAVVRRILDLING